MALLLEGISFICCNRYMLQQKTKTGREARIIEYSMVTGVKSEITGLEGLNYPVGIYFSNDGFLFVFSNSNGTLYRIPVYYSRTNSVGKEAEAVSLKELNRHYSPDGRMIPSDSPGLHIIRKADGCVEKVLVK